jgi:uncharacterized protein
VGPPTFLQKAVWLEEKMNQQLDQLIKLQQIDSKIQLLSRAVKAFPVRLSSAETSIKESEALLNNVRQKLAALDKKKRKKESELDEAADKIRKLKLRTSDIRTNKEYQALLKEIESGEKERSSIEDDILSVMEEIDAASKLTKAEEKKFSAEKDKIDALKKKIEDEKSDVEKELLTVMAEREAIAGSIDREAYDLYSALIEPCNGLVVTEARGEICQGCNMNIPPQLFVEIKKNEEIMTCPQCRRIIFYRNNG